MTIIKALTISQPYASLIADGEKFVENRTWATSYRGRLAIHAGKGTQYMTKRELLMVPHGCVIATAELIACLRLADIRDRESMIAGTNMRWSHVVNHEHTEGPWCWVLANVLKLETPVQATGAQGLWNWEAS